MKRWEIIQNLIVSEISTESSARKVTMTFRVHTLAAVLEWR